MSTKEDKIADPVNHYKNPIDVDKDDSLTLEEKITALKNWQNDIVLRQTAEAENMRSSHPSRYHMAEIERLIRILKEKSEK